MSSYVGIVVNKMQVTEVWLISIHIVSGNCLSPNTMGGNLCFQLEYALTKLEPRVFFRKSEQISSAKYIFRSSKHWQDPDVGYHWKTTFIDIPEVPCYQYMCQIHTSHCHFMIRHGSGQSSAERPYCAVLLWNACLFSGYMYKDWWGVDEGTCFLTSPLISLQNGPLCLEMGRCTYRLVACNLQF